MKEKTSLVVFFSREGENYGVGNVTTGNTQIVAEMIAAATGAGMFRIEPVNEYPAGYTECTEIARKEHDSAARPAIKEDTDTDGYDSVFIGYPNWWGDAPMAVYTFMEKHDWQGKTVIPFCTHEGSGLSNAATIGAACKGAKLLDGLGMYGHTAQNDRKKAQVAVEKWLERIGY